jgi:hypothetical protein
MGITGDDPGTLDKLGVTGSSPVPPISTTFGVRVETCLGS